MDRKDFFKSCGVICLSALSVSPLIQACTGAQYFAANELSGSYLKVHTNEFLLNKKGEKIDREFVLVKSEKLNFPIYLRKLENNVYAALWMECPHQGAELSVHGDYLSCPSHGSEFDKIGTVTIGPAQTNLRSFKTTVENSFILIHLS